MGLCAEAVFNPAVFGRDAKLSRATAKVAPTSFFIKILIVNVLIKSWFGHFLKCDNSLFFVICNLYIIDYQQGIKFLTLFLRFLNFKK